MPYIELAGGVTVTATDGSAIDSRYLTVDSGNPYDHTWTAAQTGSAYQGMQIYAGDKKLWLLSGAPAGDNYTTAELGTESNWTELGNVSFGSGSGQVATWAEGNNTDEIPASKVHVSAFSTHTYSGTFTDLLAVTTNTYHDGDIYILTGSGSGEYVYIGTSPHTGATVAADWQKISGDVLNIQDSDGNDVTVNNDNLRFDDNFEFDTSNSGYTIINHSNIIDVGAHDNPLKLGEVNVYGAVADQSDSLVSVPHINVVGNRTAIANGNKVGNIAYQIGTPNNETTAFIISGLVKDLTTNEGYLTFNSLTNGGTPQSVFETHRDKLVANQPIDIGSHFTIPQSTGTAGQVLKFPSSGNILEWADETDTNHTVDNDSIIVNSDGHLAVQLSGDTIRLATDDPKGLYVNRHHTYDGDNAWTGIHEFQQGILLDKRASGTQVYGELWYDTDDSFLHYHDGASGDAGQDQIIASQSWVTSHTSGAYDAGDGINIDKDANPHVVSVDETYDFQWTGRHLFNPGSTTTIFSGLGIQFPYVTAANAAIAIGTQWYDTSDDVMKFNYNDSDDNIATDIVATQRWVNDHMDIHSDLFQNVDTTETKVFQLSNNSNSIANNQFGIDADGGIYINFVSASEAKSDQWDNLRNGAILKISKQGDDSVVGYFQGFGFEFNSLDVVLSTENYTHLAGTNIFDGNQSGNFFIEFSEIIVVQDEFDKHNGSYDGLVPATEVNENTDGHFLSGLGNWINLDNYSGTIKFNSNGELELPSYTAAPDSPAESQVWYNTTSDAIQYQDNEDTRTVASQNWVENHAVVSSVPNSWSEITRAVDFGDNLNRHGFRFAGFTNDPASNPGTGGQFEVHKYTDSNPDTDGADYQVKLNTDVDGIDQSLDVNLDNFKKDYWIRVYNPGGGFTAERNGYYQLAADATKATVGSADILTMKLIYRSTAAHDTVDNLDTIISSDVRSFSWENSGVNEFSDVRPGLVGRNELRDTDDNVVNNGLLSSGGEWHGIGDGLEINSENEYDINLSGSSLTITDEGLRINYEGHEFTGDQRWAQPNEFADARASSNTPTLDNSFVTRAYVQGYHPQPTALTTNGITNAIANVTESTIENEWSVAGNSAVNLFSVPHNQTRYYALPLGETGYDVNNTGSNTPWTVYHVSGTNLVNGGSSGLARVLRFTEDAAHVVYGGDGVASFPITFSVGGQDDADPNVHGQSYIRIRRIPVDSWSDNPSTPVNIDFTAGSDIFVGSYNFNGSHGYEEVTYTMNFTDIDHTIRRDDALVIFWEFHNSASQTLDANAAWRHPGNTHTWSIDWDYDTLTNYFEIEPDNADLVIYKGNEVGRTIYDYEKESIPTLQLASGSEGASTGDVLVAGSDGFGEWKDLHTEVLNIASDTTLGGVRIPGDGALEIDGSNGDLTVKDQGITHEMLAAGGQLDDILKIVQGDNGLEVDWHSDPHGANVPGGPNGVSTSAVIKYNLYTEVDGDNGNWVANNELFYHDWSNASVDPSDSTASDQNNPEPSDYAFYNFKQFDEMRELQVIDNDSTHNRYLYWDQIPVSVAHGRPDDGNNVAREIVLVGDPSNNNPQSNHYGGYLVKTYEYYYHVENGETNGILNTIVESLTWVIDKHGSYDNSRTQALFYSTAAWDDVWLAGDNGQLTPTAVSSDTNGSATQQQTIAAFKGFAQVNINADDNLTTRFMGKKFIRMDDNGRVVRINYYGKDNVDS